MLLKVHSDAAYLVAENTQSRAAGHFYLSNLYDDINNGVIHTLYQLLKMVVASAAEAELAALFQNCQEATHFHRTLEFLSHPQP